MKNIVIAILTVFLYSQVVKATLIINPEQPVYYFVDHTAELIELRKKINDTGVVGITGLSGMGKSELARKYVEKYADDYVIIVFLDASVDLNSQFISIAKKINNSICTPGVQCIDEAPRNIKANVKEYFKNQSNWLLIFDNLHVNENSKIQEFLDWKHSGHIIICSQDSENLLSKVNAPFLKSEDSRKAIMTIMGNPSKETVNKLLLNLEGYPPSVLGHSAIFLHNNKHLSVDEYIKFLNKSTDKIKAHLDVIYVYISPEARELLNVIAVLKHQTISRNLLDMISDDKLKLSQNINELVRFGLIEYISNDRNQQVYRMHESIKDAILNNNEVDVKSIVNSILKKINNVLPSESRKRLFSIINDSTMDDTFEVLLRNADTYKADLILVVELRSNLLAHYIRIRDSYKAKQISNWVDSNIRLIKKSIVSEKDKNIYAGLLLSQGLFNYFMINEDPLEALKLLQTSENIANSINSIQLLSSIYVYQGQIQSFIGDIKSAQASVSKLEKLYTNHPNLTGKSSVIYYVKSRISLAQGNYKEALSFIDHEIVDEYKFLETSKGQILGKSTMLTMAEHAWMAPIFILKAEILNYSGEYQEAYTLMCELYRNFSGKKQDQLSSFINAHLLTELARAETGLEKYKVASEHSQEAITLLINDLDRKNHPIENSKDIFLAFAQAAYADVLYKTKSYEDSVMHYKLATIIYDNVYGHNLPKKDNVGYTIFNAFKASSLIKDLKERKTWMIYFFNSFLRYFGKNDKRYEKLLEIKTKNAVKF